MNPPRLIAISIAMLGTLFFSSVFGQSEREVIKKIKDHYKEWDKKLKNEKPAEGAPCHGVGFIQESDQLVPEGMELQQIMLIRHGKPNLSKKGWFSRKEAIAYITAYDTVGVHPVATLPLCIGKSEIDTVNVSTLNRAKHTSRLLFGSEQAFNDQTLFIEFQRRVIWLPVWKLPLKFWLIPSRLLWAMTLNDKGIEKPLVAYDRADQVADQLNAQAQKDKKVALVAHGYLNTFVKKGLKNQGWTLVKNSGHDYWGPFILVKLTPKN